MSNKDSLQQARDFIKEQDGVIAALGISEEELNPTVQDDLSLQAYPLEDMSRVYPVPFQFPDDSACSEFSFFEDGKQRTLQIGFIPFTTSNSQILVPIHFFTVAAVIMQREDRELKVWSAAEVEKGIFVEKSLMPNREVLERFEAMGLNIVDIPGQGSDYYDLKRRALQAAKSRRIAVEDRVIERWRNSEEAADKFLVVDGTLMNLRNEANVEQCIGVSKSFGSRYFDVSDHNRMLTMREFERSWTFRFHDPDNTAEDLRMGSRERISWYLRLRDRNNVDPEFGLIRVEISQRHADRASELADRFSRSLLSDRLPTSYPAPRWDKHLYPICACESYLASIMPSISTINASMKG